MKIWTDAIPITSRDEGIDLKRDWEDSFRQATELHFEMISDERWLVCDPTGKGKVAVLDADAFALLTSFSSAKTASVIRRCTSRWSPERVENAIALFLDLGFLQDDHTYATPLVEKQEQTLFAWLHVTNACNLRCHYCYLHKTKEQMSEDVSLRAVDAIYRSVEKHQFKRIGLKYAGGEASLYLTRILSIHDYAAMLAQQHAIDLQAYMLSNGVMLTQQLIDEFQRRGIGITISLDGIGTYHDAQRPFINGHPTFKYVDRSIHRLLACGLVPQISVTISQRNLAGLPDLMEYILEREMPFTLNYYRETECALPYPDLQFRDEQLIATMQLVFKVIEQRLPRRSLLSSLIDKANLAAPHRYTCSAGRNYLVVDQHGGIAKCHAEIEQTITNIEEQDPLQVIRENRTGFQVVPVEEKEGCKACVWRFWCTGGCPLLTHRFTARSNVKSPYCDIYKALFPQALRLEALRLLKYRQAITL